MGHGPALRLMEAMAALRFGSFRLLPKDSTPAERLNMAVKFGKTGNSLVFWPIRMIHGHHQASTETRMAAPWSVDGRVEPGRARP
jgi:hypothetical protein